MILRTLMALSLAVVLFGSTTGCSTISAEEEKKARSHRRLADAQLQKGAYALAIRQYRAALDFNSSDPEIYFGLAEAYRQKGMLDEAEQTLLDALRIAPDHQDSRLNLSVVYLMQERWDDAIRETTLLFDDPTFIRPSRALVNRAWAYYKSERLDEARSDLAEALVTDPGNFQVHLNLGTVLLDQGDTVQAMIHFQKVVELLERRPPAIFGAAEAQARFQLAQGHVKLGQRNQAIEQLRSAVELGGSGEWGEKSRQYLTVLE